MLETIQFCWISFSVVCSAGLRKFFKIFFKKNDATRLYGSIKTKIEIQRPGGRLWQDNDIRIDRGQTLADGSTNIVWQRQAQTKRPALKRIRDTHTSIIVQRVFPSSEAQDLKEDVFKKAG